MANATNYVDTSALESQNVVERKSYVGTPPDVDQVIENVALDSGGSVGIIEVQANSPARSAVSFEYDIDSAASWANTTGLFTGLAAGDHIIQARDSVTPANVSIILTLTV